MESRTPLPEMKYFNINNGRNMIKKIAILLFFISFLAVPWNGIMAQTASEVNIYFFWGEGCPHCFKEKPFLEQLKGKYPEVRIHEYEVWNCGKPGRVYSQGE